jgi:hypothetical protein
MQPPFSFAQKAIFGWRQEKEDCALDPCASSSFDIRITLSLRKSTPFCSEEDNLGLRKPVIMAVEIVEKVHPVIYLGIAVK